MEQPRIPLDEDLPPEGWRERVRDCFEALRLQQVPLTVETADGVLVEGRIESLDPLGPFGAKEASEGALHGFPPALTNAICDAVGLRLHALPATPDRVLEALQLRQREERQRARRAAAAATPVTAEAK